MLSLFCRHLCLAAIQLYFFLIYFPNLYFLFLASSFLEKYKKIMWDDMYKYPSKFYTL